VNVDGKLFAVFFQLFLVENEPTVLFLVQTKDEINERIRCPKLEMDIV
jgi:hypothetical protein